MEYKWNRKDFIFILKEIVLKIQFTKEEQERIREQYHFEERDKKQFFQMVELFESLVRAKAWYRVGRAGEIESISYSNYVLVLVTLSEYVDRLIALESEAGNLSDAYMLDCIGLEFLNAAYQQVADSIYRETGFWQGSYQFLGDQLPLDWLPFLLDQFSGVPVQLNSYGIMVPSKSVLYLAELVKQREKSNCCICLECQNQICVYRKENKIEHTEVALLKEKEKTQLNYGYQRIFGKLYKK